MPWYFRRSRKLGPFRVTISSSGISGSVGIGGIRLTSSQRGTYLNASPGGGLHFRQRLDRRPPLRNPGQRTPDVQMQQIASDDAAQMLDHSVILKRIEENTRRAAWLPWFGALVAVLLTFQFAGIGLLIGTAFWLLCFAVRHYMQGAHPVELEYHLSEAEKEKHQALLSAVNALKLSHRLWQIDAFGNTNDWKRNAGANQLVKRKVAGIRQELPRSFRCNVDVLSLVLARETLYFLPDMILVRQKQSIGSVSYANLTVANAVVQFRETEGVPGDSQQVGTTWRFVNKNGGPDRRFNNNCQIPIALYGEVGMLSDSGLRVGFMTSSTHAAAVFAEAMRKQQQDGQWNMQYLLAS